MVFSLEQRTRRKEHGGLPVKFHLHSEGLQFSSRSSFRIFHLFSPFRLSFDAAAAHKLITDAPCFGEVSFWAHNSSSTLGATARSQQQKASQSGKFCKEESAAC